ncbi:MAG: UDP-N-acetylenolpyruvoylglucosamine reductase, partial [Candidatus Sumerlaeia bacterium]|nr:UDP-N-acetylenolpyruvoylglucosamine reductase [Candidatus Sumerlaeia bacterium]
PGTLGGAIRGNAGTVQSSICEYVREVTVLKVTGEVQHLNISDLQWGYRYCELDNKIVISANLESKQTSYEETWSNLQRIKHIRANQPSLASAYSAGCIFKNPPGKSAGALIDAAGLKGTSIGDAVVSEKHANFIVNKHQARPEDVVELIKLVQQRVFEHSGIWLEPEVKLIGSNFY